MSVAIVIPSKLWSNLRCCLGAIEKHEARSRVYVIDDGLEVKPQSTARMEVTVLEGVKPFVFARNVNIGIRAALEDGADGVILCNDDAQLETSAGFTALTECAARHPDYGVISATTNVAGNVRQHPRSTANMMGGCRGLLQGQPRIVDGSPDLLRPEVDTLAFVCVHVSRAAIETVGYLDERYVAYGCDDRDYCHRLKLAGLKLGICDGCFIDHSKLRSTFRCSPRNRQDWAEGRRIYRDKWNPGRKPEARRVDILFSAWNRFEFVVASLNALLSNTDWARVQRLTIYDDGSTDGTRPWLRAIAGAAPAGEGVQVDYRESDFRSPILVMQDWISRSEAPLLAKVDSDTVLPPGWLTIAVDILDRHPALGLLGLEAVDPRTIGPGERSFVVAKQIGGIGLFRRSVLCDPVKPIQKYFGWQHWQRAHPAVVKGYIRPALATILLDRMPMEPWRGLSDSYVAAGWQRPWKGYHPNDHTLWGWWLKVEAEHARTDAG